MGTAKGVLQVFSGVAPRNHCFDPSSNALGSAYSFNSHLISTKRSASKKIKIPVYASIQLRNSETFGVQGFGESSYKDRSIDRSKFSSCRCQRADSVGGTTTGSWFVDSADDLNPLNTMVNGPHVLEFDDVKQLKEEKTDSMSNGAPGASSTIHRAKVDPIEEEAWDLLRDSVVYYCGSPIGTIAANDPASSNVLNYDQVFIRDFIPSGIAFLLKGEYDIVRNFILHTLQLQVYVIPIAIDVTRFNCCYPCYCSYVRLLLQYMFVVLSF